MRLFGMSFVHEDKYLAEVAKRINAERLADAARDDARRQLLRARKAEEALGAIPRRAPVWRRATLTVWAAIAGVFVGGMVIPHIDDAPSFHRSNAAAAPAITLSTAPPLQAPCTTSDNTFTGNCSAVAVPDGAWVGPCSIVQPPAPDPCDAVVGQLGPTTGGFWLNFVSAKTTKAWKRDNPGEWTRLSNFAAAPTSSPPPMSTPLGAATVQVLQTLAYVPGGPAAGGPLPAPLAQAPPGAADRTPPGQPSNLHATLTP